ncbi:hypothetical protein ABIA71_002088 [Stenotrophomonas sp. 2619]|uniref:anti-sigma factor n=1 Tax=Stenotrophomonas sp. 2619 TaxID=3156316 RepID=UPI003397FBFD
MNDMNHHDDADALQARLRALPAERLPPARVWQGIAAQLPAMPMPAPVPTPATVTGWTRRRRWPLRIGLGMAAALGLLMVVPTPVPQTPPPTLVQRQAEAMAAEYQQAMATLPTAQVGGEWQPALRELDSSADHIRAALSENPRSRVLLGQLQRTYALRLELTQQAVMAAGLPS